MDVYIAIGAGFLAGLAFRFLLFRPKREEMIVLADITGIAVGSIVAAALFATIVDEETNPIQVVPAVALAILLAVAFRVIGNLSNRLKRRRTEGVRSDHHATARKHEPHQVT